MNDPADNARKREELDRKLALDAVTNRHQDAPEYDDSGNRCCLDCWVIIPIKRVNSVGAVRCVNCQQEQEINDRNYK